MAGATASGARKGKTGETAASMNGKSALASRIQAKTGTHTIQIATMRRTDTVEGEATKTGIETESARSIEDRENGTDDLTISYDSTASHGKGSLWLFGHSGYTISDEQRLPDSSGDLHRSNVF